MGRPRTKIIKVVCALCGKDKEVFISSFNSSKTKTFFCDIECKKEFQKGRSPSKETLEKMRFANSKERNGRYIDGRSYKKSYCECGAEKDIRSANCLKCRRKEPYQKKDLLISSETRAKIGKGSKEKFLSAEYRSKLPAIYEKAYNTKISKGTTTPFEERQDFEIYQQESNWKGDILPLLCEEDLILLEKIGFYNNRKNKTGAVRDHMLTKFSGFKNKIPPQILRHPANCRLISFKENCAKSARYDSISIDELFEKIRNYEKEWIEQNICLDLIDKYEHGLRWNKTDVLTHMLNMAINEKELT